ncbi:MAG: class I SAM-dependent methyltransferase [Rhodothermales bacterium]|nr:class I SAM-dependent methyltransferase [Rhodothermales bacterium]
MPQWYEEWFDRDEYKLVYQHRDDEEARRLIDTIERVIHLDRLASILDVGCGRGRHSILLAEKGYTVTGIDISEQSIEEARARAREADLPVDFQVADMREQQCDECFDAVVNLFTAFGYFETDAEHLLALESMAAALKQGGWFVQDFLNAEHVRSTLIPHDERRQNGLTISQKRWIDDGRINKEITLSGPDDSPQVFTESVRLLELNDFRRFYESAGLRIEQYLGDYSGQPFQPDSPRLVLIARKISQ